MSQFKKIVIVAAIAAFSFGSAPTAHAGLFDKLAESAAKNVSKKVGRSVQRKIVSPSIHLIRNTPKMAIKGYFSPRRK